MLILDFAVAPAPAKTSDGHPNVDGLGARLLAVGGSFVC